MSGKEGTNKIINIFAAIIGFFISAFATWGLYVSPLIRELCKTKPNDVNLQICVNNYDFYLTLLQISGMFIPIIAIIGTTNFKK